MEKFIRKCEWCDTEFATEWETKLYCSRQHKEQAREHRKRARDNRVRVTTTRICKGCADTFTVTRTNQIYCSSICREWTSRQTKRERDQEWENQRKGSLRARVYLRSSGQCGICHTPIDSLLKYPDPMCLTIDHIIPRSQQGSHKIDNLQAAHNICNSKRQDRPLT